MPPNACWEVSKMPELQIYIDKLITATSAIWQHVLAIHITDRRELLMNLSAFNTWAICRNDQSRLLLSARDLSSELDFSSTSGQAQQNIQGL